jgi:type III secretion protein U
MSGKTHKPTLKRLREARKKGEVVRSRELASLGGFVALWIYLWLAVSYLGRHVVNIAEHAITAATPAAGGGMAPWLPQVQDMFWDMIWTLAPLLGVGVGCTLLVSALQTRGVLSIAPITPKFERINPALGLKNLFSTRNLFELGKMLVKCVLLIGTLGYALAVSLDSLAKMVYAPAADLLRMSGDSIWRLMGWAAIIYAIGAVLDYAHQFYQFMKQHKMSIEEVRRDHIETEGNPRIKARRRSIAQQLALVSGDSRVSSASVVVVNPTHVSVALYYAQGKTPLPRVVAKGVDALALQIRLQAERDGVPVLQDPPLARKLFSDVALDEYITKDLIDATAAAFRWAKQVDRRVGQSGSSSPSENPTPRTV